MTYVQLSPPADTRRTTAVRGPLEIRWKERSTGEDSACALDRQNSGGVLGTDKWATSQIGCRVFVTAASLHAPAVVGLSETAPVQDPAVNLLVPESLAGKPSYTRGAMKRRCALVSGPLQRKKGELRFNQLQSFAPGCQHRLLRIICQDQGYSDVRLRHTLYPRNIGSHHVCRVRLALRMMQGVNGNPATATDLRRYWSNNDLHTVTRAMKRQAVEDLLVNFAARAC